VLLLGGWERRLSDVAETRGDAQMIEVNGCAQTIGYDKRLATGCHLATIDP